MFPARTPFPLSVSDLNGFCGAFGLCTLVSQFYGFILVKPDNQGKVVEALTFCDVCIFDVKSRVTQREANYLRAPLSRGFSFSNKFLVKKELNQK